MPRPRKCRRVLAPPPARYFKPQGVPMRHLEQVALPVEGYEALRLVDIAGLSQEEAAAAMGVSRQTFGRVLAQARRAVARAVVLGRALCIEGGTYRLHREEPIMAEKIAVSSEAPGLESQVDPRFGRAAGFVLVDPQTMEHTWLDNGEAQVRAQGAGIQAAELVARAGAKVVLTGYVGPKAFQALQAAGIAVGQDLDGLTVAQAVERYQAGRVTLAQGPNREAGWRK